MNPESIAELAASLEPDFELLTPTPETVHLTRFLHKKSNLEFVYIPGGTTIVGSTPAEDRALEKLVKASDPKADWKEEKFTKPAVPVTLRPFLMAITPVSETLATQFIKLNENAFRCDFKGDGDPIHLTWREVARLCNAFDLEVPSEAQWEYAYRAGTQTLFPWGDELPDNKYLDEVVCFSNLDSADSLEGHRNPWGLVAMQTTEWCADDYQPHHKNLPQDGTPILGSARAGRVVKGGGGMYWPWQDCQEWLYCYSASRQSHRDTENGTAALRLVKNLP